MTAKLMLLQGGRTTRSGKVADFYQLGRLAGASPENVNWDWYGFLLGRAMATDAKPLGVVAKPYGAGVKTASMIRPPLSVDANGLCTVPSQCPCSDPCDIGLKMLGRWPVPPRSSREDPDDPLPAA